MSLIIGAGSAGSALRMFGQNEYILWDALNAVGLNTRFFAGDSRLDTWNMLWPSPSQIGQALSPNLDRIIHRPAVEVHWNGAMSAWIISGITKDSTSTPIAGVTVKAYRTAADVNNSLNADLQEGPAVVSDAAGNYTVCLTNQDAHYLVGYKAGSPDIAGTTLNTLQGV
jgi:hypothetical protein